MLVVDGVELAQLAKREADENENEYEYENENSYNSTRSELSSVQVARWHETARKTDVLVAACSLLELLAGPSTSLPLYDITHPHICTHTCDILQRTGKLRR